MLTQINAEASTAVAQAIREQDAEPAAIETVANPPGYDVEEHSAPRGQTDTAALLRELSGLFASGNEDSKASGGGESGGGNAPSNGGSGGASSSPPPARSPAAKDDAKKKKRGLFGR